MNESSSKTLKEDTLKQEAAYFEAHQEELLEQHPEQWVAILDQKVVEVAADPRELLTNLKARGVPLRRVLVKHLTRKEEVWILIA